MNAVYGGAFHQHGHESSDRAPIELVVIGRDNLVDRVRWDPRKADVQSFSQLCDGLILSLFHASSQHPQDHRYNGTLATPNVLKSSSPDVSVLGLEEVRTLMRRTHSWDGQ